MANEKDMNGYVTRGELRAELVEMEQRLRRDLAADFAQHANAIFERCRDFMMVLDDKYKPLPDRVRKLENGQESLGDRVQRLEDAAPKPKRSRRAAR